MQGRVGWSKSPQAMSCQPRRGGGTVLSGAQHPSRSCSRPMRGRRTPARRSERHWWRNAIGKSGWWVIRAGLVWAGTRLGQGRVALGPEGGSQFWEVLRWPRSIQLLLCVWNLAPFLTPTHLPPTRATLEWPLISSILTMPLWLFCSLYEWRVRGYVTGSRSHSRTGIGTQICQPHSGRTCFSEP